MQLANTATAIAIDDEPLVYFVYHDWMEGGDIPRDVSHVRIDLSVRAIKDKAFLNHEQLKILILNNGLEEIGEQAFCCCTSIEHIVIPNAVRTITGWAFYNCSGLKSVTLGDGQEEIGEYAFYECTSIEHIIIPNAVKAITTSRETAEKKVPNHFPTTSQPLPNHFPDFHVGTSIKCLILRQAQSVLWRDLEPKPSPPEPPRSIFHTSARHRPATSPLAQPLPHDPADHPPLERPPVLPRRYAVLHRAGGPP
jgi:hypothetical protein